MYSKFTLIDDSNRDDHYYLSPTDQCVFLGEYTARKGFDHSDTNQLIFNLKKSVERKECADYKHKGKAIDTIAHCLASTIGNPEGFTFIPIPPSKCKSDPLYDDRLVRILERYKELDSRVDYQELVIQNQTTRATHTSHTRLSPNELQGVYIVCQPTRPLRQKLLVFDDMLTTGSHFKAMESVLTSNFAGYSVGGVFVARRIPESNDPLSFDI